MSVLRLPARWRSDTFLRNVLETYVTRIGLIALGVLTSVIVARVLGPVGRGRYAVAATLGATGIQFGNLGIQAASNYALARDRSLLAPLLGNALLISLGLGSLGALVAGILFALRPGLAPVSGWLLVMALVWMPLGLGYMFLQNLLFGLQEFRPVNQIDMGVRILGTALIIGVAVLGIGRVQVFFSIGLLTMGLSGLLAYVQLRRHLEGRIHLSWTLFQANLGYGFKAYLACLFSYLVIRVDLLMVNGFLGASQTGLYSTAVSLTDMINQLPIVVGTVLFPSLAAETNAAVKWALTWKAARKLAWFMGMLSALTMVLAAPLVRALYGQAYMPAVAPLLWLMPGVFFLSIQTILVQFLNTQRFPMAIVYVWLLACVLNIGLNLWAIPHWGIVGAAIVSTCSYVLVLIAMTLLLFKNRPVDA